MRGFIFPSSGPPRYTHAQNPGERREELARSCRFRCRGGAPAHALSGAVYLALHGALIALQSLPFFSIFDSQQLSCPPDNAPQFLPPHTPHNMRFRPQNSRFRQPSCTLLPLTRGYSRPPRAQVVFRPLPLLFALAALHVPWVSFRPARRCPLPLTDQAPPQAYPSSRIPFACTSLPYRSLPHPATRTRCSELPAHTRATLEHRSRAQYWGRHAYKTRSSSVLWRL
jgi:hypothetical protein